MGREVRRVPLDFDWPLEATWIGYLCPYRGEKCPYCDGDGYSQGAKLIRHEWASGPLRYGDLGAYDFITNRCAADGVDANCPHCHGNGLIYFSPEIAELADKWEPVDPPTGEGWQAWENVSEGSPITPVYASASGLIDALVAGIDGVPVSREAATRFVNELGWAPSALIVGGTLYEGIEAAAMMPGKEKKDADPNV